MQKSVVPALHLPIGIVRALSYHRSFLARRGSIASNISRRRSAARYFDTWCNDAYAYDVRALPFTILYIYVYINI